MRTRWGAVLALGLVLWLPGCLFIAARGEVGPSVNRDMVARIEPGRTRRAQLLDWFGPPSEYERPELTAGLLDDDVRLSGMLEAARRGELVWTWQHDTLWGFGTWPGIWAGFWMDTTSELLVVFLDEDGVVTDVAWSPGEAGAAGEGAGDPLP